jgi:hypothetical protein
MGMGSFLRHLPEFRHTWEEALAHLNVFDSWMAGLHLQDHFLSLGYPPNHAQILAAPPPPSDSSARPLDHIVFDGPQNELSRCSNAQPAILITSMAYLRTLEVQSKKIFTHPPEEKKKNVKHFLLEKDSVLRLAARSLCAQWQKFTPGIPRESTRHAEKHQMGSCEHEERVSEMSERRERIEGTCTYERYRGRHTRRNE